MSTLDNIRLYDIAVMSQIFIEHAKASTYRDVKGHLDELEKNLSLIMMRMSNRDLTSMTKRELGELIKELREVQGEAYGIITKRISDNIERYIGSDLRSSLVRGLSGYSEDEEVDEEALRQLSERSVKEGESEGSGIFGIVGIASASALMSRLMSSVNPVTGKNISESLRSWDQGSLAFIENLVVRARANGLSFQELSEIIFGTPEPSLISGMGRRNALERIGQSTTILIDNVVQQAGQDTIAAVASAFTRRYRWASVIDGRTTDVCRARNGRVYEYKGGPRPPAHYRCRSTIVPVVSDDEYSPTFSEWKKTVDRRSALIAGKVLSDERFNILTDSQSSYILNKIRG